MSNSKIKIKNNIIEIKNSSIGVQTILVNGKIESKKFSFSGTNHYFSIEEDGKDVQYVLVTKVSSKKQLLKSNQILVDLRCKGDLVKEDILIEFGTVEKKGNNENKNAGIKLLKDYEIQNAIVALKRGLDFDKNDPQIYFHLACCYSIEENSEEAFNNIKKAVENNLKDKEKILNHEMLAYIRVQDGFKRFVNSGFTEYDEI